MAITFLKSKIIRLFKGGDAHDNADEAVNDAKSFTADQQKEAAFDARKRGVRTVRLDRIVGSLGRYQDFDRQFRLKQHMPSARLEQIKTAMRRGQPFKPVKLYQIKDEYYAVDGNHRIAAAKELGHDEILGDVIEFLPTADPFQKILYHERAEFADLTQLPVQIELTEVNQYSYLLDQIVAHQRFLGQETAQPVALQAAARDWHQTIYRPLVKIIQRARLLSSFANRTLDDLYVYISHHQWELGRTRWYGAGIDKLIPKDMEAFRQKMAKSKDCEYPELHQGITAFVLMTVDGKREMKIMDKLHELEQVREIHSVHGDVDLLVKIVLTRDLLSSDAQVIAQFVHERVRQLQGVISTKTLIPGHSLTKAPENDGP